MPNCKVIALCNQKGGVTKTTTTANLGIGLAIQGKTVLLVDADPQADLTARPWLARYRQHPAYPCHHNGKNS